jgi:hypothetical protein
MDIGVVLGAFIEWPFLALAPAAIFAAGYVQCRRSMVLVAALAWFAYFAYERAMKLRILCSGECNIRVDLLLFYPLLVLVSVLSVVAWRRARREASRVLNTVTPGGVPPFGP